MRLDANRTDASTAAWGGVPRNTNCARPILSNVRSGEVASAFIAKIDQYRQRAAWHGHTAEGNLSGGNLFRGLYNITIKSIGAARKKDSEVRLDAVIDYGEPMDGGGFYFMDSPGNDLESIAGQVASGRWW